VSPICLPFGTLRNKTYTGLKSLVAGWGATDLGNSSSATYRANVGGSRTRHKPYVELTDLMINKMLPQQFSLIKYSTQLINEEMEEVLSFRENI
jgi:hypothetical protein